MASNPVTAAVSELGSQAALARALGVTDGMVWQWCHGYRRVAPKWCIPIERATDYVVTRHDLRPDVFGEAPSEGFLDAA